MGETLKTLSDLLGSSSTWSVAWGNSGLAVRVMRCWADSSACAVQVIWNGFWDIRSCPLLHDASAKTGTRTRSCFKTWWEHHKKWLLVWIDSSADLDLLPISLCWIRGMSEADEQKLVFGRSASRRGSRREFWGLRWHWSPFLFILYSFWGASYPLFESVPSHVRVIDVIPIDFESSASLLEEILFLTEVIRFVYWIFRHSGAKGSNKRCLYWPWFCGQTLYNLDVFVVKIAKSVLSCKSFSVGKIWILRIDPLLRHSHSRIWCLCRFHILFCVRNIFPISTGKGGL